MNSLFQSRLPLPTFRSAQEIVTGPRAHVALKGLRAQRVFVLISGSVQRTEVWEKWQGLVKAEAVEVFRKSWDGEPTLADLESAQHAMDRFGPDVIIAVGGGSILDAAKILWLRHEHPDYDCAPADRPLSVPPLRGRCRMVAIPTTVGAGSEVSSAAVVHDPLRGSKTPIVSHDFLPDLVILDPGLTVLAGADVLLPTVTDALSHAVEGYVSSVDFPLMDAFAEEAVRLIARHWRALLDEVPDAEAVHQLQVAALMAGWVQNHCLVGLSHAIAHQIGGFGVGHGLANGLLMPAVIAFNAEDPAVAERYEHLARACDLGSSWQDVAGLFADVTAAIGSRPLPALSDDELEQVAALSLLDLGGRANPRPFSTEDVRKLWEKVS